MHEQQGERGGKRGQQEHLEKELRHDAASARAQSVSGGELLLARCGTRIDEDRDIQAGREQEKAHEKSAESGKPFLERLAARDQRASVLQHPRLCVDRIVARQRQCSDRFDLRLGIFDRVTARQPPEDEDFGSIVDRSRP